MKVVILTDALGENLREDEADTLVEVKEVQEALLQLGHTVTVEEFSLDLPLTTRRIEESRCDLVFNLVENLSSSNLLHLVPLLCHELPVPCSGGSAYTLMMSGDKQIAKKHLALSGLPTPAWLDSASLRGAENGTAHLESFLGIPLILKPTAQEASVGITDSSVRTFTRTAELRSCLTGTRDSGKTGLFAEHYIDGREFNLSILPGGYILPVCEMCFVDYPTGKVRIVGYEAKWQENSFAYQHTQRSYTFSQADAALLQKLQTLARETYQLFGNSGYARVDFRVDTHGNPFILEMNSNPCIAHDSGFIAAAKQAGLSYAEVIELLIKI